METQRASVLVGTYVPPARLAAAAGASFLLAASVLFGGTALLGCHSPEPRSPDARLTNIDPPQNPDLGRYPARVSVDVLNLYMADSVRNVCSGPAPFFEYDSAKVDQEDKSAMNGLAQCMKVGALQGKSIILTGRTDPRGTEEYNEKLGLERAEKIKAHLVKRGVEASRVKTTSVGKEDASPFPKDWPTDRRVSIDLATP